MSLSTLPVDLLLEIPRWLDVKDAFYLAQACQTTFKLSTSECAFWSHTLSFTRSYRPICCALHADLSGMAMISLRSAALRTIRLGVNWSRPTPTEYHPAPCFQIGIPDQIHATHLLLVVPGTFLALVVEHAEPNDVAGGDWHSRVAVYNLGAQKKRLICYAKIPGWNLPRYAPLLKTSHFGECGRAQMVFSHAPGRHSFTHVHLNYSDILRPTLRLSSLEFPPVVDICMNSSFIATLSRPDPISDLAVVAVAIVNTGEVRVIPISNLQVTMDVFYVRIGISTDSNIQLLIRDPREDGGSTFREYTAESIQAAFRSTSGDQQYGGDYRTVVIPDAESGDTYIRSPYMTFSGKHGLPSSTHGALMTLTSVDDRMRQLVHFETWTMSGTLDETRRRVAGVVAPVPAYFMLVASPSCHNFLLVNGLNHKQVTLVRLRESDEGFSVHKLHPPFSKVDDYFLDDTGFLWILRDSQLHRMAFLPDDPVAALTDQLDGLSL